MRRVLNVHRDVRDGSERHFAAHYCLNPNLPKSVDLRPHDTPIRDQGESNACTGFAWSGLCDFVLKAKHGGVLAAPSAPLFVYYGERVLDWDVNQDSGSGMREGGHVLSGSGFCREAAWPFVIANVKVKPSAAAYADAKNYINKTATLLSTVIEMKSCLAAGFPFVLGIDVPEAMMNIGPSGRMPLADWNTPIVGGHALLCVGYDDVLQELIIRNSWGTAYGDHGYFRLPYAKIDVAAFDCYTIR